MSPWVQARRVFHTLDLIAVRHARQIDLTPIELFAFYEVAQEQNGLTASALARRISLTPASLTSVIDRLTTKRLLVRDIDSRDRRKKPLRLTADGQQCLPVIQSAVQVINAESNEALKQLAQERSTGDLS